MLNYIESKRGLRGENESDNKKMGTLSILEQHFKTLSQRFSKINDLYVFVFTKNKTKLGYYKSKWPLVRFLDIEDFSTLYL